MKSFTTIQRRNVVKQLLAGSLSTVLIPTLGQSRPELPLPGAVGEEAYWELVKQQFAVPANRIMLNAANLCPSPYFIGESVQEAIRGLGKDVSFQYRAQYGESRKKAIESLAAYVGVVTDEVGITRNTSESNNLIVNGLDLKPGDEVILWDQNHPSNSYSWEQRAKRFGFSVKKISVPASPQSPAELVAPFAQAITPKTKVIAFSHISNTSGIALPAKEICQLAKAKNILTLLDGAQSFGMLDLNLKEIGCDFFSGSTHKWLMGPLENGILYINRDRIGQVWPSVISAGWKESSQSVDEKFCVLGQRNDTTLAGLPEIIAFHNSIGKQKIEARTRELASQLKGRIQTKLPQAAFVTPLSDSLSAGVVVVNLPGKKPADVTGALYQQHGIAAAPSGGIRLSPHIYNTLGDIDKVVQALVSIAV